MRSVILRMLRLQNILWLVLGLASLSCQSKFFASDEGQEEAAASTTDPADSETPDCIDPDLSMIDSDVQLTLCDGTQATGQRSICAQDGQVDCVVAGDYKALDVSALTAAAGKISSLVTIAGVAGTLELDPGDIKSGVEIGGVTGIYPSETAPLDGATATPDLSAGSDLTHDQTYEFFTPEGSRLTINGDSDIEADNVISGVTLEAFGVTGNVDVPAAEDVRFGVATGQTTGLIKTNCRSMGHAATFNASSLPGTGMNPADGDDLDWWDTVDDFNNGGVAPTQPIVGTLAHTDAHNCSDGSNFVKISTSNIGQAIPNGQTWNHVFKETYSGLELTNVLHGITDSNIDWAGAVAVCDGLSHASFGSNWRLPTLVELVQLAVNGIYFIDDGDIGDLSNHFWSATSVTISNLTNYAWYVNLLEAAPSTIQKFSPARSFFCVR